MNVEAGGKGVAATMTKIQPLILTCGITLFRSFIPPDMRYCGELAVGEWDGTPVCEEHLRQHSSAFRWSG